MTYYQMMPRNVDVGDQTYMFRTYGAVNIAMVRSEHVDYVLGLRDGCCGISKSGVYQLATPEQIAQWEDFRRREQQ